jgi:formylglycine-generating enzyme required for sulfatase activity
MRRLLLLLAACGSGVSHDPVTDDMVAVPSGGFEMGCHMATDPSCEPDELPYHVVDLAAFHIDRTEVTEAAYGMDPASQKPVTNVSWFQADAFCKSLGKRLPTEAEWEKAARGTDDRVYPWGNDAPTCELANFKDCGEVVGDVGMHPAGASPYGALDMAGNVAEWVADWYGSDYYATSPAADPTGPSDGTNKVTRGGDYSRSATDIRVAVRREPPPGDVESEKGFRCAAP